MRIGKAPSGILLPTTNLSPAMNGLQQSWSTFCSVHEEARLNPTQAGSYLCRNRARHSWHQVPGYDCHDVCHRLSSMTASGQRRFIDMTNKGTVNGLPTGSSTCLGIVLPSLNSSHFHFHYSMAPTPPPASFRSSSSSPYKRTITYLKKDRARATGASHHSTTLSPPIPQTSSTSTRKTASSRSARKEVIDLSNDDSDADIVAATAEEKFALRVSDILRWSVPTDSHLRRLT